MRQILLLLFISFFCDANAQWSPKAELPGDARMGTMSFVYQDVIYVVGGLSQSGSVYYSYSGVWKYDPVTDSWDSISSYPGGNIYGGVCFIIDSIAYIGMGSNQSGNLSKKFWAFNLHSKQWTQKADFPSYARVYPFYNTAEGKGYVGCGLAFISGNQTMLSDMWRYDPSVNSWLERKAYPGGASVGIACFSIHGKIYAGLGDDGSSFYNDFYEYNPATNDWDIKTAFSGENKSFPSCTESGSKGYMLGGEKAHLQYTNHLWSYDANSDKWTKSSLGFSGLARRYAVFHLINNKFYYGLGQTGPGDEYAAKDFWSGNTPLSINDIPESGALLFPNPVQANSILTVVSPLATELLIFNALGAELARFTLNAGSNPLNIPLKPGIYFVVIPGSSFASRKLTVE